MTIIFSDPTLAKMAGFEKPILHGLCTFGIAARHIVTTALSNDAQSLLSIQVSMTSRDLTLRVAFQSTCFQEKL